MQAEVFNLIDQKQKKYFDLLEKICNIESNSADFEGVRAVNDALCDYAQGLAQAGIRGRGGYGGDLHERG